MSDLQRFHAQAYRLSSMRRECARHGLFTRPGGLVNAEEL